MGDIINSRSLDDEVREKVTQAAKIAFDQINSRYRGSFLANLGLVRGDSFEGILLAQHCAPQIMQDIIKTFYNIEKTMVRISVVMGQLTVTSPDRNEVDGPAFVDVQAALAQIKERGSKHWMQVSFDAGILGQSLISSQLGLITALTEGWTDKQREICWTAEEIEGHEAYPKETKKQELYRLVAKKLDSTPAVIKKQMIAASYEAYRHGWDGIESYLMEIDEHVDKSKSVIEESYIPYLNMGQRKLNQHNFYEALLLLKKALSMAKNILGENNLQLAPIYTYLANAFTKTAKYQDAENMIKASFELQKAHPKTERYIETLIEQADLAYNKLEYANAKTILLEAIAIASDLLSNTHPLWRTLFNNLAVAFYEMEDYETAYTYYMKAREHISSPLIEYAITLSNLVVSFWRASKFTDAREYAEAALCIFEENLPPNHKYITDARRLLNDIEDSQKGGQ